MTRELRTKFGIAIAGTGGFPVLERSLIIHNKVIKHEGTIMSNIALCDPSKDRSFEKFKKTQNEIDLIKKVRSENNKIFKNERIFHKTC